MSEKQPNLDSLFEAAVEIKSAKERAAFLDKSCGDDQELRQQIEQLLQSNDQVGSFLEQPAPGVEASVAPIERDNIPKVRRLVSACVSHRRSAWGARYGEDHCI